MHEYTSISFLGTFASTKGTLALVVHTQSMTRDYEDDLRVNAYYDVEDYNGTRWSEGSRLGELGRMARAIGVGWVHIEAGHGNVYVVQFGTMRAGQFVQYDAQTITFR